MEDIWKRDEIESPCVNLCVMHPKAEICMGCFRTLDEIANWSSFSATARESLIKELPARQKLLKPMRKNRKNIHSPK